MSDCLYFENRQGSGVDYTTQKQVVNVYHEKRKEIRRSQVIFLLVQDSSMKTRKNGTRLDSEEKSLTDEVFTSGTTGRPKGVEVLGERVCWEGGRTEQMFELE